MTTTVNTPAGSVIIASNVGNVVLLLPNADVIVMRDVGNKTTKNAASLVKNWAHTRLAEDDRYGVISDIREALRAIDPDCASDQPIDVKYGVPVKI